MAEVAWLYRRVPRSMEVADVLSIGEVRSPRPERVGEQWRWFHVHGHTETEYTSWTTERSIAEEAVHFSAGAPDVSGDIVIFRVRVDSMTEDRVFPGLEDDAEFLIEGTVEGVTVSTSAEDEENHDE